MPVEGKKSKAWIPVLLVVLVLILGGGGYFAYTNFFAGGGINSPLPSPTVETGALLQITNTLEETLEVTPTSQPESYRNRIAQPNPNGGAHCHACSGRDRWSR